MIRYSLRCSEGHGFDGWFQSAEAFDTLSAAGRVSCAVCGTASVGKAPMAPTIAAGRSGTGAQDDTRPLSRPASEVEARLAELRRQIEQNSEYVGMNFAAEARAIHDGDAPARSIWGETRPDEARQLLEDGLPVAPLPFMPPRRTN